MAYISVTYSFANSTTADATQVNTNLNDIITGLSNGTKDIQVSQIIANGNVNFKGNAILGDASSDTITFTGSIAANIPIKTGVSPNIGTSATNGLGTLYFFGNTRTVGIKASASLAASWDLTLPTTAGTAYHFLRTNGSGVTTFASANLTTVASLTGDLTLSRTGTYAKYIYTPNHATSRTLRLDNSFKAGDVVEIVNAHATNLITVNDNTPAEMCIFSNYSVRFTALSDSPATSAAWHRTNTDTEDGKREYSAGTAYSGVTLTVSSATAGFAIAAGEGTFVPQKIGSNWWLNVNIRGTYTSATITSHNFEIAGIAISGSGQGLYGHLASSASITAFKSCSISTNNIVIAVSASGATTVGYTNGLIRLSSKPTWAY
jgi:hypothetical protein